MDPNRRLHLNFPGEREHQFNDRAYPTTPSTFPQPVFQGQGQGAQQGYPPQQMSNGYDNGYFMNNPYPPQYQQSQGYQHNLQSPQVAYQQRPTAYNNNDVNNGLANQFLNQNLGSSLAPPSAPSSTRQNPGAQRLGNPRAGAQGQYGDYLTSGMGHSSAEANVQAVPPPRNTDIYDGLTTMNNATACRENTANFFKQSVDRARDRNQRGVELDQLLADPKVSETRKEQKRINLRKAEADYLRFLRHKENPQNFTTLKVIGKGAFGEVRLVQKKQDGKIYALKSLVKAEMFKKDQLAHVRAERDVLSEANSPWVVKLFTTFQDTDYLYMLMEFLPGGDLMTMLIKYEIFSEDITRFYMAEIVLAIETVHKLGYVHRDIKPDNILLDKGGHIKLTDFGLSTGFHKEHENSYYQNLLAGKAHKPSNRNSVSLDQINLTVSNRAQINTWRKSRRIMAYSTVGTPDYIAPEIFGGEGYAFECDWWSLGTIMFECLVGWPPFCAEDAHDTYRKIVNWRETLYFPDDIHLSPESEHLIRSLICDSNDRLGKRGGAQELKDHAFFKGVFGTELRSIRAPFEPKLTSNVDVSYFPTDEIDQTDTATTLRSRRDPQTNNSTAAEMSIPFIGYTYKRFDNFGDR